MTALLPPPVTALLHVEDPARVRDLRRMKAGAAGLLAVAAGVFVATFALPDSTWVGYVRAAAEAGMVGGLADWFAVTALFRRPLGLPIPHTALIPTRKDALASQLGDFVTEHFLTADNVVERLREAHLVPRLGAQLAEAGFAERLSRETAVAVAAALDAVREDDITVLALDLARRDAARRSYAPVAGRLLQDVTAGGAHRPLLDVVLPYLRLSLVTNRTLIKHQLKHFGETYGVLGWVLATDRRAGKLIDKTVSFMHEIERDPRHGMRTVLDDWLHKVAHDLQHDAALAAQVDRMAQQVLDDPATADWLAGVVAETLQAAREQLQDPAGPLTQRLSEALVRLGTRAVDDPAFQAQLEHWLEDAVLWAVQHYAAEFTSLVRHTIDRWDGPSTARRVELMAGRDLQFIRINGTVVGALAGVGIHAVAVTLA
jgi:uncharacterized membrane-anchored protein YjiN (DUF445 family)